MKNFVKKLSFVLAAAMVVTSVAVPVSASAATKGVTARYAGQKKSSTVVTSKTIWAGGKKVNFDYVYGKKTSGIKGTWTSSDPSVVTVDSATGKATALKKGDVTVTFTPKSKKYAAVTVAVKARVRATSIILHDGADRTAPVVTNAALKVGESKTYYAELRTKTGTKSSYFVKAATSNASAAAVKNGAEDGSYKGDNYGRNVTVTANATGSSVVTLVASPYSDDRTSTYDVKAEFPVTVKTVVSTSPVYQTERNEITVAGVASGTSLVVVRGDTFTTLRQNTEVLSTKANADGTVDTVVKLKDGITENEQYTVFTAAGVKVGSFVGESERVAGYKIDESYLKVNADKKSEAIGKIKLTNQWGHDFSRDMANITVTASGSGKNASTVTKNTAGNYVTVASLFSDNRTEKGACYFTVESSKTDKDGKTIDFADGDIVNFTVVYTDGKSNFVQTVNLTVKGTSDVSAISLYEEGFYQNVTTVAGGTVSAKKIENTYSEDDMKASPAFKFFIAWPSGKAKRGATVKAYLDGDKNKEISIGTGDYNYIEKLSTNGVYDPDKYATRFNGERTVTVNLKNIDIKAGTHTIYVVYSEDGKDYTLTSQKFTLEKDSSKNPEATVADNIVTLGTSGTVTVSETLTTSKTTGTGKDSARTDVAVAVSSTDFNADANNSGTFKLDFYGDGSSTGTTFDGVRTNVAVQVTVDVNKKDGAADSFTITGMKKLFVPAALADGTDSYDVSYSGNVITVTRKQWVSATKTETYYYVFTLKVQ